MPEDFSKCVVWSAVHTMGPVEFADCLGDVLPEEIKQPIFAELVRNITVNEDQPNA